MPQETIPVVKSVSVNGKELCVFCWNETEVDARIHIDLRAHYVEGSGQHCLDCHERVYGEASCQSG